jgi:hypothetical protein
MFFLGCAFWALDEYRADKERIENTEKTKKITFRIKIGASIIYFLISIALLLSIARVF